MKIRRRTRASNPSLVFDLDTLPPLPTQVRGRLEGGRVIAADQPDGGMWLFRKVPLEPMESAKSDGERFQAGGALMAAYREVGEMSRSINGRRGMSKSTYRETQLLTVRVPAYYEPPEDHPYANGLHRRFREVETPQQVSFFGVKLKDSLTDGKTVFKSAVASLAEQWQQGGLPVSAFDKEYKRISAALARAGLVEPSESDFRLIDAWWNHGRRADTPYLPHLDHMHIFPSAHMLPTAQKIGAEACETWPEFGLDVPAITFAAVTEVNARFEDPRSRAAMWGTDLFQHGAVAVSVRGVVEPPKVTQMELQRNARKYEQDIQERQENNKYNKFEVQVHLENLREVEQHYALGGTPTLIDASVTVAFNGAGHDMETLSTQLGSTSVEALEARQPNAWVETQIASTIRANPVGQDLPVQTIAHAGFQSREVVGDDPTMRTGDGSTQPTALVGFTENDKTPVYLSSAAASAVDAYPLTLVAGATRSGKTVTMLWLCKQWTDQNVPCIFVDPKPHDPTKNEQGFGAPVRAQGGQVYSLGELVEADGVFDSIRTAIRPEDGVAVAASLLGSINPWGTARSDVEVDLRAALAYGVAKGATCIGQALILAENDDQVPSHLVRKVIQLVDSDPVFRSMVGVDPHGEPLRTTSKLTLIEAGSFPLEIPPPGVDPSTLVDLGQRMSSALVRMMVQGSTMALSGRDGVVVLDEAWMFLAAGRVEMERLSRLAGSQRVSPILATQKVADAVNAGLAGAISRGLVLHLPKEEAFAACELFGVEPTRDLIERISAPEWVGAAPNWNSLRALWDRKGQGRRNLRGAIGFMADLDGRFAPTEITIPPDFLAQISTNALDVDARAADKSA